LGAGTAYLAAMWLDNRLSSQEFNDLKLVGQFFTTKWPWWIAQGLAGHYTFSMLMALVYARFFYSRLPLHPVLKGVIFLNLENALLYPLGPFIDRFHAGIKSGQLPPMATIKSFLGQVVRHIAFGFVLGLLYRPANK
jgi:hypothetical protein